MGTWRRCRLCNSCGSCFQHRRREDTIANAAVQPAANSADPPGATGVGHALQQNAQEAVIGIEMGEHIIHGVWSDIQERRLGRLQDDRDQHLCLEYKTVVEDECALLQQEHDARGPGGTMSSCNQLALHGVLHIPGRRRLGGRSRPFLQRRPLMRRRVHRRGRRLPNQLEIPRGWP